ncbi:PREDICTED: laminin subunit alpha-1-like [Acropora digitifera]|uniref:laminin subunit alpha-1-like n=1 Tax=Acropora digitifera TaxID=70779 RepID=UPI00077A5B59|nr:PREDICTED: laminin subunit alpha-1-like [Acropora digitifera]
MAQSSYQHADGLLGGLTNGLRGLNKSLATAMSELSAANKSVMENATRHAANLTVEATERQREFNRTLSHGARAVSAIDTFDKVVELANQSLNTSLQVNQTLHQIKTRLDNLTLVSSKLRAQVNSSEQATLELLERTQNRETNLTELRASVSLASRVFMDAVTTGKSVDEVYSIIQFRKDSLKLEAELNSTTHSVLANAHIANEFSEKSSNISGLVNAGVPELMAKAQSVALTLERGSFVKFQYDLGTGPIEITNWAVRVQPGHWYTAYATRYGKEGRLTVTDHSMNLSRTYDANSSIATYRRSTDFDSLDNIYVGGLPDGAMVNKSDRYFSGCIDNVLVNQESLNLWKPVKVDGNRSFCSRRPPAQLDVISGTTFFGVPGGHVKQKIGDFNITGESEMEFIFRTFLRTAFITSVLNGQNYVYGVYLNESKVMFYFKTSSNESYTVQSSLNSYSDGRWYKVHVVRGLKNASLTVRPVGPSDTGAVDYNMITTSTHGYLPVGHAIFFGGKDPNSPINAPVSSSFAGALRMINVSGSASSALMPRRLNSANYTESFSGVRFAQVLPRVRKIYCDLLLKSSARFIPTDCTYPILMRRSDPHISRQPTETNCKDHKSDMMLTFVVVIKISGFRALGWQTTIMRSPAQSHI